MTSTANSYAGLYGIVSFGATHTAAAAFMVDVERIVRLDICAEMHNAVAGIATAALEVEEFSAEVGVVSSG